MKQNSFKISWKVSAAFFVIIALMLAFNVGIIDAYADGEGADSTTTTEVKTDDSSSGTTVDTVEKLEPSAQADGNSGSDAHEQVYQKIEPKEGSAVLNEESKTDQVASADGNETGDANGKGTEFKNDIPEYIHSVTTETVKKEGSEETETKTTAEFYFLTENDEYVSLTDEDKKREDDLDDSRKVSESFKDPDDDSVTTVETVVESYNAIQKAVDEAIKKATEKTSIKELVITVKDGEYDYGIEINKNRGTDETNGNAIRENWSDFTLCILSSKTSKTGSEIDISSADDKAKVGGEIRIDGINVILAGLCFNSDCIIKIKDANVDIYGTAEDDTITVEGEQGTSSTKVKVFGGPGDDTVYVKGKKPEATTPSNDPLTADPDSGLRRQVVDVSADSIVEVQCGKGQDTVKVDSSSACFTTLVKVYGNNGIVSDGSDTLVLTGAIRKEGCKIDDSNHIIIQIDDSDLNWEDQHHHDAGSDTIINRAEKVTIYHTDIKEYTDEIPNKDKLILDLSTEGTNWEFSEDKSQVKVQKPTGYTNFDFTDIVIDVSAKDSSGNPLFYDSERGLKSVLLDPTFRGYFSNLIVNGDEYTANSLGYSSAPWETENSLFNYINVIVNGRKITIAEGAAVIGNVVRINANDSDVNIKIPTESNLSRSFDIGGVNTELSVFDVVADAAFTQKSGSVIKSFGSTYIICEADLTHDFIPVKKDGASGNAVSVKVGKTDVNLEGSIVARGNIKAESNVKIKIDVTNELLSKYYVPLAVNVGVANASLIVAGTGNLNAGFYLKVLSSADVTLNTTAVVGVLPITAAVSVVSSNAQTTVRGTLESGAGKETLDETGRGVLTVESLATSKVVTKAANRYNVSTDKDKRQEETIAVKNYGGFIAVAVVSQTADTEISGGAVLKSHENGIDILSTSKEDVTTVASSEAPSKANPKAERKSNTQKQTDSYLKTALNEVKKYLKDKYQEDEDIRLVVDALTEITGIDAEQAGEKVDGIIDEIEEKIDTATKSADKPSEEEKDKTSSNQFIGAVAVTVASSDSKASIMDASSIKVEKKNKLNLTAKTVSDIATKADASQVKEPEDRKTANDDEKQLFSLGVGVAVDVVNINNLAQIVKANIDYTNVDITAQTDVSIDTESKAGFSAGGKKDAESTSNTEFGLAGAISVGVHNIRNYAVAEPGTCFTGNADIPSGISLVIFAKSKPEINISAIAAKPVADKDASGNAGVGVGAAIAVDVTSIDVIARFKGVSYSEGAEKLTAVEVRTSNDGKENVSATAGSVGGTSITPSVAVMVTGVNLESTMGDAADRDIELLGNATLEAINVMDRAIVADSSSAGEGVAIGGAFSVDVIDDSADANLKRSLNCRNLSILSCSNSKLKSGARAGAKGANTEKDSNSSNSDDEGHAPSADEHVDCFLDNAGKLAAVFSGNDSNAADEISGTSKGINAEEIKDKTKDRQKAETSEGKVGVAASVAVNIQSNTTRSLVIDGVDVILNPDYEAKLDIESQTRMQAKINSDASTCRKDEKTNGEGEKYGIAVAVGVNTAAIDNEAAFGNGSIQAKQVNIRATNMSPLVPILGAHEITTEAVSGAGATDVGIAGSVAIAVINNDVTSEIAAPAQGKTLRILSPEDVLSRSELSVKAATAFDVRTIGSCATTGLRDYPQFAE